MKDYIVSYSYRTDSFAQEDGVLSYGQKKFQGTDIENVIDSLYQEVEGREGAIVGAIYFVLPN